MQLNFIIGRAGSGKSDKIAQLAAEKNGILIVPETHSFAAEKQLLTHCSALGFGGAEVLSFQRLAHRFADRGPLGKKSIDAAGKNMAISMICQAHADEIKAFGASAQKTGFATEMLSLIKEFKRYDVSPEALISFSEKTDKKLLAGKLGDIALIYGKYLEFISAGYTDSDDDLSVLCAYLAEKRPLSGRHVFIDRFSSFTPIEHAVIKQLISQCEDVTLAFCASKNEAPFHFKSAEQTIEKLEKTADELGCSCSFEYTSPKDNGELSFLEENYFSYTPNIYDGPTENISLFVADSMYSETENVARTIFNLVREKKADFSDISVICRESDAYAPFIKSIFPLYNIPFTDTERTSAALHPLSLYIIAAVEASIGGKTFASLLKYLKSGFCTVPSDEADLFENYILASGVYPSQFFNDEKWSYKADMYRGSTSDPDLLSSVNATREKILSELIPLKNALKSKLSAEEFCRAIYAFTEQTRLSERVTDIINFYTAEGETDAASSLESIYNCIISVMDSLIACSKDALMPAANYLSVFSEGLSAITGSIIPSGTLCVGFEGASRAKGSHSPIVFIMGLNNGIFPKIPDSGGILTDAERILLSDSGINLSPDREHLNYEELSLLYSTLTMPKNKLYLSYSLRSAEGSALSPSSIIKKLNEIFPRLTSDSDVLHSASEDYIATPKATLPHVLDMMNRFAFGEEIDPGWFMLYDWYKKHGFYLPKIPNSFSVMANTAPLKGDVANRLFPDSFKTSISKLESYAECHFKYFMDYVLKARPRASADFSGGDAGSLLHLYAEKVSDYLSAGGKAWSELSEAELKRVLSATTASVIENGSYYLKGSGRAVYLVKRLEALALKMMLLIKQHFESGQFIPLGSEIVFDDGKKFGAIVIPTPDGDVRLTGKVDRADILHTPEGDFIRIIDYKSGNKSFSFSEIYEGLNLQLSVYMMALAAKDSRPGGMLYLKFDDPVISDKDQHKRKSAEKLAAERAEAVKMKGLLLDSDTLLSAMDDDVKKTTDKRSLSCASGRYFSATLAGEENFQMIFKRIRAVISSLTHEMRKGDFSVSPMQKGDSLPCDYCKFKPACYSESNVRCMTNIENSVWEHFSENISKGADEHGMDTDAKKGG